MVSTLSRAAILVVLAGILTGALTASAMGPAGLNMDATMGPFAGPIDGTAPSAMAGATRSVTSLRVTSPTAVKRFTLIAREGTIRLKHGADVAGEQFNGRSPGP